jgi:hypothetical protein
MDDLTDNKRDLLREAVEHVKRCTTWTRLTEAQQENLVAKYIRKRLACPPQGGGGSGMPDD